MAKYLLALRTNPQRHFVTLGGVTFNVTPTVAELTDEQAKAAKKAVANAELGASVVFVPADDLDGQTPQEYLEATAAKPGPKHGPQTERAKAKAAFRSALRGEKARASKKEKE